LTGLSRDWDSYRIRNDHDIMVEVLERHFSRPPTAAEVDHLTRSYLSHLEAGLSGGALTAIEIPGARTLLSALRADEMAIGIATANLVDAARLRLASAGLWDFVQDLPYGADGGGIKAEILARAIAATGLPKNRIVYLGDNLNDVEAGLSNDVHFIGFAQDSARREKLKLAGAKTVCGDHDTSYQLISRMLAPEKWTMGLR
jgi:phosphoglycolate phosphatase-like HAD superfamily hydrolase